MNKVITLIILCCSTLLSFGQELNDFRIRSTVSGTVNWTDNNIWERFNGTNWINTTDRPGDNVTANDVTIGNGVTVEIDSNLNQAINSVTVGDELGGIDTLIVMDDSFIETTSFTIAYDGFLDWGGSQSGNHTLGFPDGTNFLVESPNPNPSLEVGVDHGINEDHQACSTSKAVEIGGTRFTTCSGGGGSVTFEVINDGGGNLTANPTATPSPACANSPIQLMANPGGILTATYYSWTASSPSGSNYALMPDDVENPTDTPSEEGTYIYEVTIYDGDPGQEETVETSATITVEVETCAPKTIITNRRITYRVNK